MDSKKWLDNLNSLQKPEYTSKYQSQIDGLLDKIVNREKFTYDFNADPLYQQYKDNYVKLGNEAGMNASANVSQLTGGYGNSYAATAATQANQQYLTQLNNMIPELASAAMDRYNLETQGLYNQYAALGDAENMAYTQYRDAANDYYTNRDYYYNAYNNDRNFEYQQGRDEIADKQWQEQFDYNKGRDEIADNQWQTEFDYNKDRDIVADAQWQAQMDYNKERDQVADNQWQTQFDYNKSRDEVSDAQWQAQFDFQKSQADRNFNYQAGRDSVADAQWQLEYQMALEKLRETNGASTGSGTSSGTSTSSGTKKSTTSSSNKKTQKEAAKEYAASSADMKKYTATAKMYTASELKTFVNDLLDANKISYEQANRLREVK